MRHDSKSVSLITQHHMYLSLLAINFCSSSRTMTAVSCTGIFTTLNLSRVAWWRDESSIPLSETKPAWEINPQVPWWLTALCTVWWINTAREQAEAELANCSLCCPSGTVIPFVFQIAWKLTAATMQIAAFPHISYIFMLYSEIFVCNISANCCFPSYTLYIHTVFCNICQQKQGIFFYSKTYLWSR